MNSGVTAERVYTALKRRLLGGEFRPGERLDPAMLSESLSSSVTPVRDVLNVLRGEGLVETRTGEGFFRPHMTAPDLEDLYGWSEQALAIAIRHWPQPRPSFRARGYDTTTLTEQTAELFLAIATRSPNLEHKRAVAGVNDRLHAVRTVEDQVIEHAGAELEAIAGALSERRALIKLLAAYHRQRRRHAADIVRAVYRG